MKLLKFLQKKFYSLFPRRYCNCQYYNIEISCKVHEWENKKINVWHGPRLCRVNPDIHYIEEILGAKWEDMKLRIYEDDSIQVIAPNKDFVLIDHRDFVRIRY